MRILIRRGGFSSEVSVLSASGALLAVCGAELARVLIRCGGSGAAAGQCMVDEADRRGARQESATSDEKKLMSA